MQVAEHLYTQTMTLDRFKLGLLNRTDFRGVHLVKVKQLHLFL